MRRRRAPHERGAEVGEGGDIKPDEVAAFDTHGVRRVALQLEECPLDVGRTQGDFELVQLGVPVDGLPEQHIGACGHG